MLAGCRMLNQHQKWWREPSPLQSHSPRAPTNPQQPTQACARQTGRKQAKGAAPCSTAVWEVQKWPGMCHLNWLLHPPAHGILQGEFLVWILPLVWWSCKAAQTKGTCTYKTTQTRTQTHLCLHWYVWVMHSTCRAILFHLAAKTGSPATTWKQILIKELFFSSIAKWDDTGLQQGRWSGVKQGLELKFCPGALTRL